MIKKYSESDHTTIFRAVGETETHWVDRSGIIYKKDFTRLPTHEEIQDFLDTEREYETEIVAISKNND